MTCEDIERALGRPALNPTQHIFVTISVAVDKSIPPGTYTRYEWGWEHLPYEPWIFHDRDLPPAHIMYPGTRWSGTE